MSLRSGPNLSIQAQPLVSHIRHLTALGRIRPITLPDGTEAPVCELHADNTSLEASSAPDCGEVGASSMALKCASSRGQLNPAKTQTMYFSAERLCPPFTNARTGITSQPTTTHATHLGIGV